jgi:hypothetical protein
MVGIIRSEARDRGARQSTGEDEQSQRATGTQSRQRWSLGDHSGTGPGLRPSAALD